MVNLKLSPDEKKKYLIIIGAILLSLTIFKYLIGPLFINAGKMGEEIPLKKKMLKSYHEVLRKNEGLSEKISLIKKEIERSESGLLSGSTPSLATVEIQNILKKMAEKSGVEVKTMKILDPKDNGYYKILPVQFNITSGIRELKDILYRIETFSTYLTIKKIKVRVRKKGRRSQQKWEMNSTLTITGYMKNPK